MATRVGQGKYGKYIIEDPKLVKDMLFHDLRKPSGFTYPDEVYIDAELCPEAGSWVDMNWIWEKTDPRELPELHRHPFAEIVLLIGSNPKDLRDLGGELSWGMGEGDEAETFTLTKTTAIYVPANLAHAPLIFERVDRPILNVAIGLDTGDYT
jgi:hypothetical protein